LRAGQHLPKTFIKGDDMKVFLTFILCLTFASFVFAEQDAACPVGAKISAEQSKTQQAVNIPQAKYSSYDLDKWDVKTESSSVEEALDVFRRKAEPRYKQKIWIVDKNNSEKTIFVEYTTNDEAQQGILFSSGEDFVFYTGLSPAGASVVYGMNLVSNEEFIVDSGVDFSVFTCPNNNSNYVIIQQDAQGKINYSVYNLNREKIDVLTEGVNLDNLAEHICY